MTIINPNSIAGITSLTAEADVMNFYKSDGTLAGLQLNGVNFNTTSGISTFNNVYVGGTITYEDVKNVDSVGIITARAGINLTGGNITLGDSASSGDDRIHIGAGNDIQLYHYSGVNYIDLLSNTEFRGSSSTIKIKPKTSEEGIIIVPDGSVSLYYNNSKKIETTDDGIEVTGKIFPSSHIDMADDVKLLLGTGDDLEIFHQSSDESSVIKNVNDTGWLRLLSGDSNSSGILFKNRDDDVTYLRAKNEQGVELFYANNVKFETTNTGVKIDNSSTTDMLLLAASGTTFAKIGHNTASGTAILDIRSEGHTRFLTNGNNERLRITADGPHLLLGGTSDVNEITESSANAGMVIGSTSFGNAGLAIITSNSGAGRLYFGDNIASDAGRNRGAIIYYHSSDHMHFQTAGSERLRIDSAGNLIVGSTSNRTLNSHVPRLQVTGTNYSNATVSIINNANDSNGAYLFFGKQRSGSPGGSTVVQNNDIVGHLRFSVGDGTDMESRVAYIEAFVDGTPGSNDTPGRLTFSTTPDGTANPVERLRINSSGNMGLGDLSNVSNNPQTLLHIANTSPTFRIQDTTNDFYAHISADDGGNLILDGDAGNGAGSSYISLRTDGTERVRITNGNVIQCYSPDGNSKGYIYQTNSDNFIVEADTSNSIDGDLLLRAVADGGTIQMVCGGNNERLRIDANGDVIIGATSTTGGDRLEVVDSSNNQFRLTRPSTQSYQFGIVSGGHLYIAGSSNGEMVRFQSDLTTKFTKGTSGGTVAHFYANARESNILIQNDAKTWKIVNYDYGNNGTDHLGFHDGAADRFVIGTNGYIGAGVNQPTEAFQILKSHNGHTRIVVQNNWGSNATAQLKLISPTDELQLVKYASGNAAINLSNSADIYFSISGSEKVRFKASGNTYFAGQKHEFRYDNAGGQGAYLSIQNRHSSSGTAVGISFGCDNSDASMTTTDYGNGQIKVTNDGSGGGIMEFNVHHGSSNFSSLKIHGNAINQGSTNNVTNAFKGGVAFGCAGIAIDKSWDNYPGIHVFNTTGHGDTNQGQFRFHGWNRSYSSYVSSSGSDFSVNLVCDGTGLTSDERRKTGISTITNALDTVSQLRGVKYTQVNRELTPQTHMTMDNGQKLGFIAQEVIPHLPSIVIDSGEQVKPLDNGYCDRYMIDYGSVVALLTEAIKELKSENDALKARVTTLESS